MRRLTTTIAMAAFCSLAIATSATAAPPTFESTGFSNLTTDSVRLHAEVAPGGEATTLSFEWGTEDCSIVPSPCTVIPVGVTGGTTPVPFAVEIKDLVQKTTYHFRAVASNIDDTAVGPDTVFRPYVPPIAGLPDGRAYEQASPVDKNAVSAKGRVSWVRASTNGDRVSFAPPGGIPGGEGAQEMPVYLASRGTDGWSTQSLLPPESAGTEAFVKGWAPDLSQSFSWAKAKSGLGDATLLSRSSLDRSLTPIVEYGEGLSTPEIAGSSADGSTVLFEDTVKLASISESLEGKSNVYLWSRGSEQVRLAGVMNDGDPPPAGAFAGSYDWIEGETAATLADGGSARNYYTQDQHAISVDGSRVYFTDAGNGQAIAAGDGQLYLRVNPSKEQSPLSAGKCTDSAKACTLQVSASKRTPPDPLGPRPAAFQTATPDGSFVFFTSPEELTDDANTGPVQDPPAIARSDIDGENVDTGFIPGRAAGVAVDATHIYWADPKADTIGRAALDGTTEVKPDFITGADNPQDVTVDATHIYWANAADEEFGAGSIGRATLDGGEVDQDFIPGVVGGIDTVNNPRGIDVDDLHVYWVNGGTEIELSLGFGNVGRAKLDGSDAKPEFLTGASGDVVADATHIYYSRTNGIDGFIRWANLDGSEEKHFATVTDAGRSPEGLALNATHLYWTNPGLNTIGRSSLDGASPEQEFVEGADNPKGLALDAAHLYWAANQDVLPNPGNDLYRFEAKTGALSDFTPDPTDVNGAEVRGVLGTSTDGSHVYFVANADLDGGGPAGGGDCEGGVVADDQVLNFTGECSLYLARAGMATVFVARLDADGGQGSDAANWMPHGALLGQLEKTARVSADGKTVLFRSQRQLTSYDNEGVPQLYRYHLGDTGPTCVSCNPSLATPVGEPTLGSISLFQLIPPEPASTLSRNLSADGNQVFFESTDALTVSDVNGEEGCPSKGSFAFKFPVCRDVYQWEANGTGSCKEDVQGGGCLYLLSSGKSPEASFFADASASGSDVFLITSWPRLVRQDQDQLYDVFDVRIGGGLASQNAIPPVPCEANACQAPYAEPPAFQSPGSASFAGHADPKPTHKKKHKAKKHKNKGKGKNQKGKGKRRAVKRVGGKSQ